VNGDNMDNLRCEAGRTFRTKKKKREYLKNKINELETNSKNKNIRDLYSGINEFGECLLPCISESVVSSHLMSRNMKIKMYQTKILPVVLYGCET
jgi:hypothetical protein